MRLLLETNRLRANKKNSFGKLETNSKCTALVVPQVSKAMYDFSLSPFIPLTLIGPAKSTPVTLNEDDSVILDSISWERGQFNLHGL